MPENTVTPINRWTQNDLLTANRLNQMVDAINFLLKTTGYILNRVALANYVPTDTSSFNYPGIISDVIFRAGQEKPSIEAGTLILPPLTGTGSTLSGVRYDPTATEPTISEEKEILLNLATTGNPGAISDIIADPTATEPTLEAGTAKLPLTDYNPDTPENNFPGFLSAIEYIEAATAPTISCGKIQLNPADSTSEARSGYVKSVSYNTALSAPVINNGNIQLNPADANVPGYVHAIEYTPDSTIPDIYQGKIRLNPAWYNPTDGISAPSPGYVSAVEYIETATFPAISGGRIQLNPAHYDPTDTLSYPRPGYITSVESFAYDPSDASVSSAEKTPRITNGKIIIPIPEQKFSVEYVYGAGATPGSDGWVQTLYLYGLWTGQTNTEYFSRQLMRFSGNTLQVVQQISYDGNTWSDSSANG